MSSDPISASTLKPGLIRHGLTLLNRTESSSRPCWDVLCPRCHSTSSIRADVLAGTKPPTCKGCKELKKAEAQSSVVKRKDYTGQTLSDGRFVVQGEAGRDKHGYVLWDTACTACGHTRQLRKKDLPNDDSYCFKCSAKSPKRKPRAGTFGRFKDSFEVNSRAPVFLWWVTNVRPQESGYPEPWRADFEGFFWDCTKTLQDSPTLQILTGLETARLVKTNPNLPWSWENARIAPLRGRANPKMYGTHGLPPPTVTSDGLLIHHTAQWGEPLTHHYPLPDDQWVDPEPTRDLTPEQAQNLIENSDRF